MKKVINQYIVDDSRNFIKNLSKVLPDNVKTFEIESFEMQRASGYGGYNYVMNVIVNDIQLTLKKYTHDSIDFDYYTDLEYRSYNYNKWMKKRVLDMLSTDFIVDVIYGIVN